MKEKTKNLVLAMVIAGILVGIYLGYTAIYVSEEIEKLQEQMADESIGEPKILSNPWSEPQIQAILMVSIFYAVVGFLVLTVVFSFVIGHVRKKK